MNFLTVQFQTITQLGADDGIVIKGNTNTKHYSLMCPPIQMPGSAELPSDIGCRFETMSKQPKYTLFVSSSISMYPGKYILQIQATNPGNPSVDNPSEIWWTFGTYKKVITGGYPTSKIDVESQ